MPRLTPNRVPVLVVAGLLVLGVALPMTGGELGLGQRATPRPSASTALGAVATPTRATPTAETPAPSSVDAAADPPTPTPAPDTAVVRTAIVPVTHFRTTATPHDRRTSSPRCSPGPSERYDALELVADEADAILAALGATARPTRTGSSWRRTPRR